MLKLLLDFIIGSVDCKIPASDADAAAALLVRSGADLRSLKRREDGTLTFSLPLYDRAATLRILSERSISLEVTRERGLYRILRRYRKRIGIPIGAVIFALILILSEKFIWTVEVKGNDKIPDKAVIEKLESLGCGVGSFIPSIDFDELHREFLLENREFSWVAVNVAGTHATIELRELAEHPSAPDETVPHNLVAAEDGVLESIEIYRGQRIAESGQLVRAGELLASGIIENERGLSLCHARGVAMARVEREISIEIPLEYDEKRYISDEIGSMSISILGFSVNLFENSGNLPPKYDKIDRERKIVLFGQIALPVTLREQVRRVYETERVVRTPESARAEAFAKLRDELARLDGELLSRRVNGRLEGEVYRLDCELTLLSDIAREQEIYLDEIKNEE